MPTFVCDECGDAFDSKDALQAHTASHDGGGGGGESAVRRLVRHVKGFNRKQLSILFAVVLMGTLFLGTAFFASRFTPSPSSGSQGDRFQDLLTGYSTDRLPRSMDIPNGTIKPDLSDRQQLYLLVQGSRQDGPTALLQYSCRDCPGLVSDLESLATQFSGYVYVVPHRGMDDRLAVNMVGRAPQRFDSYDRAAIVEAICQGFRRYPARYRPVACSTVS